MNAQNLFLKYAFPCAGITLARGVINQEEYDALERAVLNDRAVPWKTLRKTFIAAFRRLKNTMQKLGRASYDVKTIRQFFLKYHNNYIDMNDGSYAYAPDSLKHLCRIEQAIITKVGTDHYIVKINKKNRPISKLICANAKAGDIVSVHYGYAVEKLKS